MRAPRRRARLGAARRRRRGRRSAGRRARRRWPSGVDELRRRRATAASTRSCGVHGDRLVVVLGGGRGPDRARPARCSPRSSARAGRRRPGRSPTSPTRAASARGRAGRAAGRRRPGRTRRGRCAADDLLPERALDGDADGPARGWSTTSTGRWSAPARRCSRPLTAYLERGRLARGRPPGRCSCTPTPCATGCGGSPTSPGSARPTPRDAFALRVALALGRLAARPRADADLVGFLQSRPRDVGPRSTPRCPGPDVRQGGRVLVIVAPGQGAQTPGFLTPWLELPGVARPARLAVRRPPASTWSAYGTEADADDDPRHRDRPAAARRRRAGRRCSSLFPHPADAFARGRRRRRPLRRRDHRGRRRRRPHRRAGHGPRPRARPRDGRRRGASTADRHDRGPRRRPRRGRWPSWPSTASPPPTMNGAGQIVAAGTLEQLAALAADPPEGARCARSQVAGAFHTEHMAPAVERAGARCARAITHARPAHPAALQRRRRASSTTAARCSRRLVDQVAQPGALGPVHARRWPTSASPALLELPPAGTLAGLAKRALPGVETLALKTPDDLRRRPRPDRAPRHGEPDRRATRRGACWSRRPRAPSAAREHAAGDDARAPAPSVGTVEHAARRARRCVAPHGGAVVEWLVEDGDPVAPGQPLVRLHPEAVPA